MSQIIFFTQEGLDKIKKEKEDLLRKRKDAVLSLKTAREMGDLSENAAYHVARSRLSTIDSRLRHLTYLIRLGRVKTVPTDNIVGIGSKVELIQNNQEINYEIVGNFEGDPEKFKISNISPLGKSLIGKKPGAFIQFHAPSGSVTYKIKSINNN